MFLKSTFKLKKETFEPKRSEPFESTKNRTLLQELSSKKNGEVKERSSGFRSFFSYCIRAGFNFGHLSELSLFTKGKPDQVDFF